MAVTSWMSWEGGVDLAAATREGLEMPNALFHVARMVHTPIGSAPSGMVLWQPDPAAAPAVMGFVSADPELAAWFGPNVFRGTPFEGAPALEARIAVETDGAAARSRIEVGGHVFEVTMEEIGEAETIHRAAAPMTPFVQQGVEAAAGRVRLAVDGEEVSLVLPPAGLGGGPAAVYAAAGVYSR